MKQLGNKTECALLGFLMAMNQSFSAMRERHPEESFFKVYTFNSARKSMSTVIKIEGGGYRVFSKGASEIILKKCKYIYGKDDKPEPFGKADADNVAKNIIAPLAKEALRTICIAYRCAQSGKF